MHTPEPHNDPNLDPKDHLTDQSVREGFEVTDANVGGVAVFVIALAVSILVFFVFCYGMGKIINEALNRADGPVNKWKAANQIAPRKAIQSSPQLEQEQLAKLTKEFPQPRLQLDDGAQDLADLHRREDLLLNYYSWVDEGKGTVRIPIERAMQLIAQKGLPVAPPEQRQPLMMGDSQPQVQMPLTDGFAPTGYEQQLNQSSAGQGQ